MASPPCTLRLAAVGGMFRSGKSQGEPVQRNESRQLSAMRSGGEGKCAFERRVGKISRTIASTVEHDPLMPISFRTFCKVGKLM